MSRHFVIEYAYVERDGSTTQRTLMVTEDERDVATHLRRLDRHMLEHATVHVFDRNPEALWAEEIERVAGTEWDRPGYS